MTARKRSLPTGALTYRPQDLRRTRFLRLLQRLRIRQEDPLMWQKLCREFLRVLIPGFQLKDLSTSDRASSRKGRITRVELARLGVGRPPIYRTPEGRQFLFGIRQEGEELLRKQGEARITDVAAIKAWFRPGKTDDNRQDRAARELHRTAVMLAKRLSALRNLRPKIKQG
jgi:hypothetical protein